MAGYQQLRKVWLGLWLVSLDKLNMHLEHMLWPLLPIVLYVLQVFQYSVAFGFYSLFQEARSMLMVMIIVKKELFKNCGFSPETLSVMSLAWVLHLHFCLGWSGEKQFFHQEQTYIFKALDKGCGNLLFSLSQSSDSHELSYKDYIFYANS